MTELVTKRLADVATKSRERRGRVGRRELRRSRVGKRKREDTKKNADAASSQPVPEGLSEVDRMATSLERGCDCGMECLQQMDPEYVLKHRNNISKLSRAEHDMYLMGIIMATMGNPRATTKRKERQRVRNKYIFQGQEVCLEAFLYLENVTAYHVKAIRAHLLEKGVVPRNVRDSDSKKDKKKSNHQTQALVFIKKVLKEEEGRNMSGKSNLEWLHQRYCAKFEKEESNLLSLKTFTRWAIKRIPGLGSQFIKDPTVLPPCIKTDTVLSLDMSSL